MSSPADTIDLVRHWDTVHERVGARGGSWHQDEPRVALELIRAFGVARSTPVVDVGGGCSPLAGMLIRQGFPDVSVLDVSGKALGLARSRLGEQAGRIQWLCEDVLTWKPARAFGLWHDRAVFHFLVEQEQRALYRKVLRSAIAPGALVIIATFAPGGPDRCSGLPVARYLPEGILEVLGADFECLGSRREDHTTPGGTTQPFTWVAVRAVGSSC